MTAQLSETNFAIAPKNPIAVCGWGEQNLFDEKGRSFLQLCF
jgi:hypothetical protein